jgi:hypothetical protein
MKSLSPLDGTDRFISRAITGYATAVEKLIKNTRVISRVIPPYI